MDVRGIIEGVSPEAGKSYLRRIEARDPEWLSKIWPELVRGDSVGEPSRYEFKKDRPPIAPVSLRYALNAIEMQLELDLTGKRIVEIGGGYGGLARLICSVFPIASYSIIDIPESNRLARKFLSAFGCNDVQFLPLDAVVDCDVFIANYSVAEFDRAEQEKYFKNVILRSKCGYFVHNIPQPRPSQLTRSEVEKKLSDAFDLKSYVEGHHRCENSIVYICKEKATS
jgi:hypothetical protein